MLSKTRTTIITLVAAFSFGGAAIVPTVAQAKRKNPGLTHKERCAALKKAYNWALEEQRNATTESDKEFWGSEAKQQADTAYNAGCSWATGKREAPTEGVKPEGGERKAPEGSPPPYRPESSPPAK